MAADSNKPTTRAAFLEAAERLFSEHGYEGMRIRDIAREAGANLSALHYYWGNKETLVEEVCESRFRPVMLERIRRYREIEASLPPIKTEQISALLRAHLEPFAELLGGPQRELVQRFYTRMVADPAPQVRVIRGRLMEEMSHEFVRLLRKMCDRIPDEEFFWRLNGVLGTILHLQAFSPVITKYVPLDGERVDLAEGVDKTVHFLAAALLAPPETS